MSLTADSGANAPADRSHRLIVALTIFIVGWGTNAATPFLIVYKRRLDLSDPETMAIFVVYAFAVMFTLPIAGALSDRWGRRTVTVPFVFLSATASLILVVGRNSYPLLLVGRFLLGAVTGGVLGVGAAWLQELHGRGNEHRAAIESTMATYLGFGTGPLISALFHQLDVVPLVAPFVLHATLAIASLVLVIRVPETAPLMRRARRSVMPSTPTRGRRLFFFVIVPAGAWVFAFPSTSFALFPVVIADAIPNNEVLVAGAMATLTAWSGMLSRPIVARLGLRPSIPLGMTLGCLGYVLGTIGFATSLWSAVLPAAICLGTASGLLTAGPLGLLATLADDDTRGAVNSTFYLLAYQGMAMPLLLSLIGSATGLTTALILVTVVAFVAGTFSFKNLRIGGDE